MEGRSRAASRLKEEGGWWTLKDQRGGVVTTFKSKAEATTGGQLAKADWHRGRRVRIHKVDGTFEEERTFPRVRSASSIRLRSALANSTCFNHAAGRRQRLKY